jgi:hypothetical protein
MEKKKGKGKEGKRKEKENRTEKKGKVQKIIDANVRKSETGCPSTRATVCTILKGRSQVE